MLIMDYLSLMIMPLKLEKISQLAKVGLICAACIEIIILFIQDTVHALSAFHIIHVHSHRF